MTDWIELHDAFREDIPVYVRTDKIVSVTEAWKDAKKGEKECREIGAVRTEYSCEYTAETADQVMQIIMGE